MLPLKTGICSDELMYDSQVAGFQEAHDRLTIVGWSGAAEAIVHDLSSDHSSF